MAACGPRPRPRRLQGDADGPGAGRDREFPPGVQGADPAAGHVAVVESVDASKGTFTISEMNAHGPVYTSRELPIAGGANFILPMIRSTGPAGASSTATCSAGDQDGEKASVEEAKRIAKRKMKDMGWDDGSQFECLDTIFTEESGWRWDATNPDSGAYGIPSRCRRRRWPRPARIGGRTRPRRSTGA